MRFLTTTAFILFATLMGGPAQGLENYPAEVSEQFMSWCSRTQDQPQSVCSCALNKAALEIPASALASFLNAAEGGGMSASTQGVGATALQIVGTCTLGQTGAGTSGGTLMKSLGGALGQ